jgi:threonine dehydrogenase-like Zn-dependent dehydrogenase
VPGDAPPQSMLWAAQSVMKAGVVGVIGVFPPQAMTAPIGTIQQRNLTVRGGNCNHRRYMPKLVALVATGAFDPTEILTQTEPITNAIEAYKIFDRREPGWIKVELNPVA